MAGCILDNGLESPLNRGTFYAYRDTAGRLEGVALIGHVLMMKVHSEAAVGAFAQVAQRYRHTRVILGEQGQVRRFWRRYAPAGQPVKSASRELLLELSWPVEAFSPIALRPAKPDALDQVLTVNARMAVEEGGGNPMEADPAGFRERTLRRIEQGRIWVFEERGRLMFKADVVSETPEVIYLEGVYVRPDERGRGLGTSCVSQLCRHLLRRAGSVCLLVGEQNRAAQSCYRKVGFKARGYYDAIFLRRKAAAE